MKRVLFLLGCFMVTGLIAQVRTESFESYKLTEERQLRIYIPEDYSDEEPTPYPLIVVMDAEYLFDPVVSAVKYYSYWKKMPNAIVVGIDQNAKDERFDDCDYSDEDGLPHEKGSDFFEFVGEELVNYMAQQYKIASFKMLIGHGFTGNFANYYMFYEKPVFSSVISLSPDMAPYMEERVAEMLKLADTKTFYYLATAENDDRDNKKRAKELNKLASAVENENVVYKFDIFEGADHNSMPSYAIPKAFDNIFDVYKLISPAEFKEKVLPQEGPVHEYLVEKYNTIEQLFGFRKPYNLNDIMAIYAAAKKKDDLEALEFLGNLGKKEYPETMLGFFFMAEFLELSGEPKQALKAYEKAFNFKEIDFITKDLALQRMDALKADFGW
ncbi:alpha/beta hydrolase [Sungkyunkwania multivorans]|uniref:Alpha/beta hydrolase n=1 Tax=Sungkyunkwania multivorans TaxID=1173618 RepID=A0ABW3D162_9FLAO